MDCARESLRAKGAVFVDELSGVPEGSTLVFSAHGVAPAVRAEAKARGLRPIDATCPLVTKVHLEALRFAKAGYQIVLVGHAGHAEVEGTMGEAPEAMILVQSVADVAALEVRDPERLAYLTQTTLSVDETTAILAALKARFPNVRGPAREDICYATTNRQAAVKQLAAECDLVLVVGSQNSSNSRRLVETAHIQGKPAYLIDDDSELNPEWLAGKNKVLITAGASAPEHLVQNLIDRLRREYNASVETRTLVQEDISFELPKSVRTLTVLN